MTKKLIAYAASLIFLWPIFSCADEPNTVVATINVGENPAGLAVTPNNLYAYVANTNNNGIPGGNTVSILNLTNNTLLQTISDPSFNGAYTVTINRAGTRAYVTNSGSTTVTIIELPSNTVMGTIGGFNGPTGLVITSDGNYAYVNNYGVNSDSGLETTVSVVDLTSNMIVGSPITVGQAPAAMAITPDGAYVYVVSYVDGNPGTGTISIIKTSDNSVQYNAIKGFFGPYSIAITPDGKYAYVTNFGSNNFSPYGTTVSVVDISRNTIIKAITLGTQPAGLAITPNTSLAFVSNYNTLYEGPNFTDLTAGPGTVDIINIETNSVIAPTINVGSSPGAIAISHNGKYAYVSNFNSNTVNVIALSPFQITALGCKIKDQFLSQIDLINQVTWSVLGTELPISYSIYTDAALTNLAATFNASEPFEYIVHDRKLNISYTYYITGTNANGAISFPLEVPITTKCSQ